jgi:hypothetical protein
MAVLCYKTIVGDTKNFLRVHVDLAYAIHSFKQLEIGDEKKVKRRIE